MNIFAILGSHPTLSLSEIAVVTGQKPSFTHGEVAIFDDVDTNLQTLNDRLGGVQRVGVIIGSVPAWNHEDLAEFLVEQLINDIPAGKISYGFSIFNAGNNKGTENARQSTQALGIEIKRRLKAKERGARYVISNSPTLSSVVIRSNHLLDKGAEFVLFMKENEIVIGKTVAVQDADSWSARDFGRPRRNAKQGMLPPKLARMMLNLTGADLTKSVVFDPFCGSGTILMEATLLDAKSLIGSDINAEAIDDTNANLVWMTSYGTSLPPHKFFALSAQTVAGSIDAESVDCLVTETYLGRPRKGTETRREVEDAVSYVANLYKESFSALLPTMKTGAVLLIAAPVHTFDGQDISFDARVILEPLGYTHSPLPFEPIIYRHADQLVGRRLWRFTKA